MGTYDDKLELEIERFLVTENFDKLYGMLKTFIVGKSRKYTRRYQTRGLRIYEDDFSSVLWEATLELLHDTSFRKNSFRVVLNHRLEDRARNIVRHHMADKRRALTIAMPISATYPSNEDVESAVINKINVEQLSNDSTLTVNERRLLNLLKQYPLASNQDLAVLLGYTYREKVRRLKLNLRKKGEKYFADD